jgi:acyl-coenzyme A synthetase/AMP-(fatty) acid ligase/alkanesulfonate monooxygenase SsuD/methylene tetrahydromethanopterin reductase-like flavin-dependent oxidoreductase (luciferase family)
VREGRLRSGLRLPQYAATWSELRDAAARAEALGFDALWLNDHLRTPGRRSEDPAFDALTALAALAPLTSRARLGVAVLSASYRAPALAAKMATVLDVIAGGRLVVGLGAGSDADEHRAYGMTFGAPAERTAQVQRALRVMRAMGAHPEGVDLPGVLAGAHNLPASPQRPAGPPIWLAAHGPALLRLAGREADGVVAAFLRPEELARRRGLAERARAEARRPPLAYAVYIYALAAPTRAQAVAWVAPEAEALGTSPEGLLRWLGSMGLVGTAAEVREGLRAFAGAGATDAILVLPNRSQPEAVEALAEAAVAAPGTARGRAASRSANLCRRLVEAHREAGRGRLPAVVDDEGGWSFDRLSDASARAAGRMRAAGVRGGERVAVALPDGRAWVAAVLGACRLGAVAVPLDPGAGAARLTAILDDCDARAVVTGDERVTEAAAGRTTIAPGELALGAPAGIAAVHPDDLGYLVYSSGSTGAPKAAMHAHRDVERGIQSYGRDVMGLAPGDRCHSVARAFTSFGFGNGFFRVLGCGATAVMSARRPTVRAVLATVARAEVTVLSAVPTFWAQLATFLERHPDRGALAGVRLGVSSGDSLPPAVGARVRELTGLELLEGLGCAECSTVVISTRRGEPLPGTIGRAVPGVEVRLADDEGRPVAPGDPGRLWIRSDSNTSGYWRRTEETRGVVFGPWVRMADVLVEREGVYRHVGRVDDLFKVDARLVSPIEIEAALHEHPAVDEAAVVGRPDERGLVRPAAFVVLAPGATADGLGEELRRHVARRVAPHAAPATVEVRRELPRLASGKIDRRGLRTG